MFKTMETGSPVLLDEVCASYSSIYTIISPPRCSSTVFARIFWEQPTVGYYSHEPFEVTYYHGAGLAQVAEKLAQPLDLQEINPKTNEVRGEALVIKEMPYQVGNHFPLLASLATPPLIFLICDPRLNIASRIAKKEEVGDSPFFPLVETGWELLAKQIEFCRHSHVPYLIVDTADFRNFPNKVLPKLFDHFGLAYSPEILTWEPHEDVVLDNLGGAHSHLYWRVLGSTRLYPATEPIPALVEFPAAHGVRAHVADCLEIYASLRKDPQRIRPYPQPN